MVKERNIEMAILYMKENLRRGKGMVMEKNLNLEMLCLKENKKMKKELNKT